MQRAQFRIPQNAGWEEILCRLHRPNKNVARENAIAAPAVVLCKWIIAGQCRANGTSREIFAILVFALEFNIENMKLFHQRMAGRWLSDGSRMTVRLRWNFKAENVRERARSAIKHGYAANKFTLAAENASKEFASSHSILPMSECYQFCINKIMSILRHSYKKEQRRNLACQNIRLRFDSQEPSSMRLRQAARVREGNFPLERDNTIEFRMDND